MLVRIDGARCIASLHKTADAIDSYGFNAWRRALDESKAAMHQHGYQNKTGKLTASMKATASEPRRFGWEGTIVVSAPYAQWVDAGTGIYGPFGQPIKPVVAPFLRFFWDKTGHWMSMREVRGMPGAKFSKAATERFLAAAHSYIQSAVDSAVTQ